MVHSLTTAFISPEGESLLSNLTGETHCSGKHGTRGPLELAQTQSRLKTKTKKDNCLHTLPWFLCSLLRPLRRPPTCHHETQHNAGKTSHSHSFPDHAGSTLSEKENKNHQYQRSNWDGEMRTYTPTCVDVAVFAPILRSDDRSHIGPAQWWEEAELSVESGDFLRVCHHLTTSRRVTQTAPQWHKLPNN